MTIEQAIKHAREVAEERKDLCEDCRGEHLQLALWLEELKSYKEKIKHGILIDTTKYFIRTEEYKPYQTRYIICKYGAHTDVYNFYTDKEQAERDLEMIYNV